MTTLPSSNFVHVFRGNTYRFYYPSFVLSQLLSASHTWLNLNTNWITFNRKPFRNHPSTSFHGNKCQPSNRLIFSLIKILTKSHFIVSVSSWYNGPIYFFYPFKDYVCGVCWSINYQMLINIMKNNIYVHLNFDSQY